MERLQYAKAEDRERFLRDLFAPAEGADPDRVPDEVADEEMSLFYTMKRKTESGTGR